MGLGAAVISSLSIAAVVHMNDDAPAKPSQPHLVMMIIDDLGWTDVRFIAAASQHLNRQRDAV